MMIKVIADSRENKKRVTNLSNFLKEQKNNYEYSIKTLETADYVFISEDGKKQTSFEYKTIPDLVSSIQNGSVFEEIINQANQYEYTYLIIVGNIQKELKSLYYKRRLKVSLNKFLKTNIKMVNGAINRIYSMNIPIVFANNEDLAFEKMVDISKKIFEDKLFIIGRKRGIRSTDNPALTYLSGVKDLNIKTAELVTTELNANCLLDLIKFNEEELLNIKGIGGVKSNIILKSIFGDD